MKFRFLTMVVTVMEFCAGTKEQRRGHPRAATVRVLATLRRFLREGTPWRSLRASADQVSGSTLRRHLEGWAKNGLLQRVHAVLVRLLRGGSPDLILDTCSVRAKRGGALTDPNPTDRGKRRTKYQLAVTGEGLPVACAATAANINDTVLLERLFLTAFAALTRIRTVFADKAYDAQHHRDLCHAFGTEPRLHKRGQPRGSGLGKRRAGRSSAAMPGSWRTAGSLCATIVAASLSSRCFSPLGPQIVKTAFKQLEKPNCVRRVA